MKNTQMNKVTTHFANLFAKSTDLTGDFILDFTRTFACSVFDKYTRNDGKVYIKHSVDRNFKNDVFSVEAMTYEYKGCWVGSQKTFGTFDNFIDAVSCARNVKLSDGVITEDEALVMMSN